MNLPAVAALLRAASERHGVTTVSEAKQLGVSRAQLRTLVRNHQFVSPHRGILVSTSATPSWAQDASIATLSSGGVLSHRGAARLHRFDGFERESPEVTVPMSRPIPEAPLTGHRSRQLEDIDVTTVHGILVTSKVRTLIDLGAVVGDDKVEQGLDHLLRTGTSVRAINSALERLDRPGRSGCGALKRVLARPDRAGPLPDSKFERLVERVCVAAGLPQPIRQYVVRDDSGRIVARLDAAWPEVMLGLEAHSDRWHSGVRNSRRDQNRDNLLSALGWELLYANWAHTTRPAEFTSHVRMAYQRRAQLFL
ncbi:MAG: type IV toxin-antitoxin system AbiEi family antitoxin domain-containing protein [Microthrixaceae bacterium]